MSAHVIPTELFAIVGKDGFVNTAYPVRTKAERGTSAEFGTRVERYVHHAEAVADYCEAVTELATELADERSEHQRTIDELCGAQKVALGALVGLLAAACVGIVRSGR